jgi:hypothetical protein
MLCRVALVRPDVSEERSASIPDVVGATFLLKVGSYKIHTA